MPDGVGGGGTTRHSVRVDAFPIGIDPRRFRRALDSAEVKDRIIDIQRQYAGVKARATLTPLPAVPCIFPLQMVLD
eukprot:scaffold7760_cov101-Isochrysis_galbana.AAC.2